MTIPFSRAAVLGFLMNLGISACAAPEPSVEGTETAFLCESGEVVVFRYNIVGDSAPEAQLNYRDYTLDLESAISASGARYVTLAPDGAASERRLEWWMHQGTGTLRALDGGQTVAPEANTLERCVEQGRRSV